MRDPLETTYIQETIEALCEVIETLLDHIKDEAFAEHQRAIYNCIMGNEVDGEFL